MWLFCDRDVIRVDVVWSGMCQIWILFGRDVSLYVVNIWQVRVMCGRDVWQCAVEMYGNYA